MLSRLFTLTATVILSLAANLAWATASGDSPQALLSQLNDYPHAVEVASSESEVVDHEVGTLGVLLEPLVRKGVAAEHHLHACVLDSFEAVLKGGSRGAVVKKADVAGSELIRRIKGISQPRMPMTGPPYLSDSEIAVFERWVEGGLQQGEPVAAAPEGQKSLQRPAAGQPVTYQHVAPIFAKRCAKCHSDNGQMGRAPEGYRLTSHTVTLSAGDRVRVIPGNPAASELVRRIRGQSRPQMPFDGPPYLDTDKIRLIEDWIAQGARNSDGKKSKVPVGAKIRLHGRLESGNKLDGIQLIISSGTRIDKNPRPGDYVQVRGRVDKSGDIQVDRLRRR